MSFNIKIAGKDIKAKSFCDKVWIPWAEFCKFLNYKQYSAKNMIMLQPDGEALMSEGVCEFDKAPGRSPSIHIALELAQRLAYSVATSTANRGCAKRKVLAEALHKELTLILLKIKTNLKELAKKKPAGTKAEPKTLKAIPNPSTDPAPGYKHKPKCTPPAYIMLDVPSLDYIRGRLEGNRFSTEQQNSIVYYMKKVERLEETILELSSDLRLERMIASSIAEDGPHAKLLKKIADMATDNRVSDVGFRHTAHTLAVIDS